jgi:alpha-ketoglutarate-dependent taurine dioxygenase
MEVKFEPIKPAIGSIVHVDRSALTDPAVAQQILEKLEERAVLVFPRMGLSDAEQLAFTDSLGARVKFTQTAPGGDRDAQDVYTITLDPNLNPEPEYVLGTFFWHMDGVSADIIPPKASVLSALSVAPKGGQTEFASTHASFEALSDEEKTELAKLRVMHSAAAAMRAFVDPHEIDANKAKYVKEHPLLWKRRSGLTSMMIGYTADYIVGMGKAEGRALLARLLEWTSQPAFTYRHHWQEGDLVIWDNTGALHRVIPYAADSGRKMHRTSVAGVEAVA